MKFKSALLIIGISLLFVVMGLALISAHTQVVKADPVPNGWYYTYVTPDSYYKIQGSSVRFMGSHFWPGEHVTISTDGKAVDSTTADMNGAFTSSWVQVPYSVGNQMYTITGDTSRIPFNVYITVGNNNPWIILSTYYAGAGAPITIDGHQFGAAENVTVWFNGINIGTARTNDTGDFTLTTTVPHDGAGQWTVSATGAVTHLMAVQPFSQAF